MTPTIGVPLSAIQLIAIGVGILVGNVTILTAVAALAWRLIRAEVMELIQKVRDEIGVLLRDSRDESIRLKLLSDTHEAEIEKLRQARHDAARDIEKLDSRLSRLEGVRLANGK